jgi:hypothetical protein
VFKFGDAASSVDAAMASLCVQLWEHALDEVTCCCFVFFARALVLIHRNSDSTSGHGDSQTKVWLLLEKRPFGQRRDVARTSERKTQIR